MFKQISTEYLHRLTVTQRGGLNEPNRTVRGIRALDGFLKNADDRIVEDLLDVAATESLEKTIQFMGVHQRSLVGALGGQKGIARGAAIVQDPNAQLLRNLVGRSLPTGASSLANSEQLR